MVGGNQILSTQKADSKNDKLNTKYLSILLWSRKKDEKDSLCRDICLLHIDFLSDWTEAKFKHQKSSPIPLYTSLPIYIGGRIPLKDFSGLPDKRIRINIAKGTTDPRVDFRSKVPHKSWSNFNFGILIKHYL